MRCLSISTARSFRFSELQTYLQENYTCSLFRQVVYVKREINERTCEVFYFPFGVMIIWGSTEDQDAVLLNEVSPFENEPLEKIEVDKLVFSYGKVFEIVNDLISLPDENINTKLALSHAMAQSVKLSEFEIIIQNRIDLTKKIPVELATKGKTSLSKKEIRKTMGEIFIERSSINLHFELLDIPDFFWENVKLEPLYLQMVKYMEIRPRVDALNKKILIVHELFEMLGNELDTQHGSRLEWIIIILILIEVILSIGRDISGAL